MTEKALSIKRAMTIIQELDSGGLRESIKIVPLKQASAERIAEFITKNILGIDQQQQQRIIQPQQRQETAYFSKNIKVIPDIYSNALIMLGTESALDRIIEFVNLELDKPLEAQESRLHIKELKYTYAEKLKTLLDVVIKPPTKDARSQIVGQVKYFEDMIVSAETAPEVKEGTMVSFGSGNRLMIACNKDDWQRIERFIDKIDKPQPQVAMEVLFVDVKVDSDRELGAQLSNKNLGQLGNHIHAETQHLASESLAARTAGLKTIPSLMKIPAVSSQSSSGAAWISAGREGSAWAVAKMLFKSDNLNIISQPYLVANNHQKSELNVSKKRNLEDKISSESTTAVKKKKEVVATLLVELTPSINSDGVITLNVLIKIDEFASNFGDSTQGDTTNRHVQTQATMADGEVLILGGLVRSKTIDSIRKTPLLGDIPIIGNFFKRRSQELIKEDLHIFIRPTIIKPRFEGVAGDYSQLKLDYAKIQIGRQTDMLATKDPIQRWFFHTEKQTEDFKQIDGYAEGKNQPRSVIIPIDPYYKTKTSRTIQRLEKRKKHFIDEESKKKESEPSFEV
jgi:general secretion pathway protein D